METEASADERRAAFERVVADVVEPVRRFLARRTDPSTAEDVLAEVLLVLWRRLDAVPAEPLPWTYGITRNCLANAHRSARRQQRLAARIAAVDPPHDVEQPTDQGDARVQGALAALRPAEAELLRLWAWEDLGPTQIAEVLGITANAASIRLHRAREKFKEAIRKIPGDDGHDQVNEGSRT